MRYVLASAVLLYSIITLSLEGQVAYEVLLLFLVTAGVIVFKERYADSLVMGTVLFLLICADVYTDARLAVLLCMPVFDYTFKRAYWGLLLVAVAGVYLLHSNEEALMLTLLLGISGLLAFALRGREGKESEYRRTLDDERRLRYELEQTKDKLLRSSLDIANIAEIKERNRIAREIHDTIGHRMAGVLVHLQASFKLRGKDEDKSLDMLAKSIASLSGTIDIIRDTVHNIKPKETLGVEYIHNVIDNFKFCPVELKLTGDFNSLPAHHLEIITTNVKEALTNAYRYSAATEIAIAIDANEQFTRVYIKDNGIGCHRIKEGLGLSGMKERIRNVGGSISISGMDGFLIVSLLPRQEGGIGIEGSYRG
ncbi:hypothetical protein PAECIP111893_01770 [Paenibacillus plantiphilus]|uniref:histidine kinase n=1 Tax=Paenibacillus plantiphilus TaxID=2905650 RepID=A0ABN8GCQ3_9BACL|nr:sensor histidine kinase [Paenibacillus plantiphilus]CAH1201919.1 hypothetical protein PAECIP111893_01770 [Paenibacillus plantiphilus]